DRASATTGEHEVTRVFAYAQIMAPGQIADRCHIGRQTHQVHRYDGTGARRNLGLDQGRVDVVRVPVHIDEHGAQMIVQHDIAGGDEGDGGYQDFIAVAPAVPLLEGGEGQVQGTGSAVAEDSIFAVVQLSKQRLE